MGCFLIQSAEIRGIFSEDSRKIKKKRRGGGMFYTYIFPEPLNSPPEKWGRALIILCPIYRPPEDIGKLRTYFPEPKENKIK